MGGTTLGFAPAGATTLPRSAADTASKTAIFFIPSFDRPQGPGPSIGFGRVAVIRDARLGPDGPSSPAVGTTLLPREPRPRAVRPRIGRDRRPGGPFPPRRPRRPPARLPRPVRACSPPPQRPA